VLEALAVTLGRNARARAIQLPARNEALGLPRPRDQQWSLRIQQMLAYETDLLEYPNLFEGSKVMDGLVESHRERPRRIESGEQVMVGVNRFEETEPSPLTADGGSWRSIRPWSRRRGRRRPSRGRPGATSRPRSPSCAAWRRPTRTSCRPRSRPSAIS